ncbi:MAG: response regulator [Anaerolineae bacterium]|nr:response regulator [Anaerolineae bacterium]
MPTESLDPSKYVILIVDDEAIARDIFEGYLAAEGYHLVSVNSGWQALKYLEQNQVDLVLLDVMMPHMDGFEVCTRLKSNARWRQIPVILTTAFWNQEQMDRGVAAGAESFLPKPVNGNVLRTQIRLLLQPQ